MIAREKTYNSIARSFRSKPHHLIYLSVFFFKTGRQIKKLKQKQGQRHSAEYFHNKLKTKKTEYLP